MLRPNMNVELQSASRAAREPAQTLGDVLYGADFEQRIPETDWIAMLHAIAGGDTSAFGDLYMMTHGVVFTLIMRITGARDTAEDLTIEVFHEVWRTARSYHPSTGSVIGWLMNLARAHANAHPRMDPKNRVALVRAAVDTLTPGERQAIEATFHAGATSAEAAAKQGTTTDEVETRIRAALGKLGEVLTPLGDSK